MPRKKLPVVEPEDEVEESEVPLSLEHAKRLLKKETASWGSMSDELRTRGEDAEERATREFARLRNRKSFKPGRSKF